MYTFYCKQQSHSKYYAVITLSFCSSLVFSRAIAHCAKRLLPMAFSSVRPSHAGSVPRRMKIGSCGLHCDVAKSFLVFLRASKKSSIIANRKSNEL